MKILILLLVLSSILVIGDVFADSDGSFCVGKDYVAVEARGISLDADEPSVFIISISSDGLFQKKIIATPPDLNKQLSCQKNQIILSDGHKIDLTGPIPRFSELNAITNVEFSDMYLTSIKDSKVIKVPSTDSTHLYSLVMDYNFHVPRPGLVFHFISARVVKASLTGHFISSELITEGIRLETID